jgi:hypothetical protein
MKVWLTYAWLDNKTKDVDFIAQQIMQTGVEVHLDRWDLIAGLSLWDQIKDHILNPAECDAWVIFATQNSLGSEPCQKEYGYAFKRIVAERGAKFPLIALFPGPVDVGLLPPEATGRWHVTLTDNNWVERIKSAAEGRSPDVTKPALPEFETTIHVLDPNSPQRAIELRPRAGVWAPFFVAIPAKEHESVNPDLLRGPRGNPPLMGGGMLQGYRSGTTNDGWSFISVQDEATPTTSYYLLCDKVPSTMRFGVFNGAPQFLLTTR